MKTKAFVVFLNRSAHFDADIEVADIFAVAVANGALKSDTTLFEHCDPIKHPIVAARNATEASRKLATKHLNVTLRSAYIKDLYEDFSAYLANILRSCAKKGLSPDRLIGEHKFAVDANELLSLGTWDAVVTYISTTLFRKLENERSTIKLLSAIDAKLNIKIDAALRDAALPFLDLRHLLVHQDGHIDTEYCTKYPALGFVTGNKVTMSHTLVTNAKASILALIRDIDVKIVNLKLIHDDDLQP
jgi:hypothetical protein